MIVSTLILFYDRSKNNSIGSGNLFYTNTKAVFCLKAHALSFILFLSLIHTKEIWNKAYNVSVQIEAA